MLVQIKTVLHSVLYIFSLIFYSTVSITTSTGGLKVIINAINSHIVQEKCMYKRNDKVNVAKC